MREDLLEFLPDIGGQVQLRLHEERCDLVALAADVGAVILPMKTFPVFP